MEENLIFRYTVDPTQEFIALGISNIGNSFFQSFPVSAGMSRSSVNYSANVATQISGWFGKLNLSLSL